MCDDLFFVPIIDAALDQPDRPHALRKAFRDIRRMGHEQRHRRGYRQFLRWMQEAALTRHQKEATHAPTSPAEPPERPAEIELVVERDGATVAKLPLKSGASDVLRNFVAGSWRFLLDTGCIVWDGFISREGEFVDRPRAGEPLRMAAATPVPGMARRDEIQCFDGALAFRLRSGASGRLLEIEFQSREV